MGVRKKGNADYEKGYRKGYKNGYQAGKKSKVRKEREERAMIAIPNMDKPETCDMCPIEGCEYINGKFTCPLIEIVQCKDCIYNSDNTDGDTRGWCYKHGIDIIGFCSEGERRNDDHI